MEICQCSTCGNSGWNIFLRDHVKGQQLGPEDWTRTQEKCRQKWGQMSAEERSAYQLEATQENHVRAEACLQPFAPKACLQETQVAAVDRRGSDPSFDAAGTLTRNALKNVARHRSLVTYKNFKESSWWKEHDAGIATVDGALDLDLIDVHTSHDDLYSQWESFARREPPKDFLHSTANSETHHGTCWSLNGGCQMHFKKEIVPGMVFSLAGHIESRS